MRANPPPFDRQQNQTIRLSLAWVLVGLAVVLVAGGIGGAIAQRLISPPRPPLTGQSDRLVTTIQEVTISPNTATADVVQNAERSVLLIGPQRQPTDDQLQINATALVATSDGLVVTSGQVPNVPLVAFVGDGPPIPLNKVGDDALFGLTYFKLKSGVAVPLELASGDSAVGSQLIAVSRSSQTLFPAVDTYQVKTYLAPPAGPAGWQRLAAGTSLSNPVTGAPLLDDEGKVAGLVVDAESGLALPAVLLRQSIDRVVNNQREFDPFETIGLSVFYSFALSTDSQARQFTVTVQHVSPGSPAALAGVKVGDTVQKIANQPVQWDTSVAGQLSQTLPLSITVHRGSQDHTLTLSPSLNPL